MTLRLNGTTSGYVEIDSASTGGNNTIVLPSSNGNANQFLKNGSTAGTLGWSSLVEDSSNRLLVGTSTSPSSGFGQYARLVVQGQPADATGGGNFSIQRGEAAAGGNITSGEGIGNISWNDNAGNTFGLIGCEADANAGTNDYPGRLVFSTTADGASSPTEQMRITNGGYIGFGTATFGQGQLATNIGTNYYNFGANTSNAFIVYNSSGTGVYLVSGNTAWTANSDERLKTNLQPITNAAQKISTLRAVTGRYVTDPEDTSRAFLIAQDVKAVLPEAVNIQQDENGTLGLQYTDVIPLLVAAVKEQQVMIAELQAEVVALKGA